MPKKILTIGSVGSAPHMREMYSKFNFFYSSGAQKPEQEQSLGQQCPIEADFLKEVPFQSVEICKENFRGHICPKK
jgi:hypothetical protein